METPGSNISYHDLSSLNELRSLAKKDEKEAVRQAAKQFESVFMSMLLSSMRKANKAFEQDNPLNTNNTEFFRDMYDQQLSTALSKNGALGLADLMVKQLSPDPAPSKLNRQLSMPGDIGAEKTMAMPHQQTRALQLPAQNSGFKQLDPERIILNVAKPKITAQQLEPERELTQRQAVVDNQLSASGVQKLSAETLWQNTPVDAGQSVHVKVEVGTSSQKSAQTQPMLEPVDETAPHQIPNEPLAFVQKLLPAAKAAAQELGLEPMALLAQAALETGWGQRLFKASNGAQSNNLFGIKASGAWSGEVAVVDTLEYRQGMAQREKAKFRVYATPEQSMQDYVAFIKNNPRYQEALANTADAKTYFRKLQAAGYATDPNYAEKLTAVFDGVTFNQVRKLLAKQLTD